MLNGRASTTPTFLHAVLVLILMLVVLVRPAHAQTGEDALRLSDRLPATGPVMVGYAGAGIGGVADIGALYTNPAALGYFEDAQASGALNGMLVSDEADYRVSEPAGPITNRDLAVVPANGNLVYRFPTERGSLVFVAGFNQVGTYQRQFQFEGLNTESSITETFQPLEYDVTNDDRPVFFSDLSFIAYEAGAIEFFPEVLDEDVYPFEPAAVPGTALDQRGDIVEEGHLRELNFGGAVEALPDVMMGLSVNISFGRYEAERFFEEEDALGENQPEDYIVIREGQRYEGFESFQFIDRVSSELEGVNLRGGISATLTPGFRLGATIETPTLYTVENSFGARMETFFQDGSSLFYSEQSGEFERRDFQYDIRTPWRFGGGILLNAGALTGGTADLRLAADVEFVDWSQLELSAGEGGDFTYTEENRFIRDNYQSVVNTRLGLEVGLERLALRTGFAYQPDPRGTELGESPGAQPDRGRIFLSAGVGYQIDEQLQFNAGWMQERFEDRYIPYADPFIEAPPVHEQIRRNHIVIGLNYSF